MILFSSSSSHSNFLFLTLVYLLPLFMCVHVHIHNCSHTCRHAVNTTGEQGGGVLLHAWELFVHIKNTSGQLTMREIERKNKWSIFAPAVSTNFILQINLQITSLTALRCSTCVCQGLCTTFAISLQIVLIK